MSAWHNMWGLWFDSTPYVVVPGHMPTARRRYDNARPGRRLDRMSLASLPKPERTKSGALRGEMVISHLAALEYGPSDDPAIPEGTTFVELVDEESLRDPEFLRSVELLPITIEHVPDANPKNVRTVRVGQTGQPARYEDGNVIVPYVLDTEEGIAASKRLKAVSLGYDRDLDRTPGMHDELGRYDAIQRNRRGNHVAMTLAGRAQMAQGRYDRNPGEPMDPIRSLLLALSALGHAVEGIPSTGELDPQDVARRLDASMKEAGKSRADMQAKYDAMMAERDALQADMDKLKADMDGMKEEAERRADSASADFHAAYKARRRLDSLAEQFAIDKAEDMSNDDLSRAIGKHVLGAELPEDASDAYVQALVDCAGTRRHDSVAKATSAGRRAAAEQGSQRMADLNSAYAALHKPPQEA